MIFFLRFDVVNPGSNWAFHRGITRLRHDPIIDDMVYIYMGAKKKGERRSILSPDGRFKQRPKQYQPHMDGKSSSIFLSKKKKGIGKRSRNAYKIIYGRHLIPPRFPAVWAIPTFLFTALKCLLDVVWNVIGFMYSFVGVLVTQMKKVKKKWISLGSPRKAENSPLFRHVKFESTEDWSVLSFRFLGLSIPVRFQISQQGKNDGPVTLFYE